MARVRDVTDLARAVTSRETIYVAAYVRYSNFKVKRLKNWGKKPAQ